MLRNVAVALCSLVLSSSAFAQVYYEPVKSQYDTGGLGDATKYYYGGNNPLVHQWASTAALSGYGYSDRCPFRGYARNLHRFDGGNSFGQPSPLYDRTPVYTDCIPYQDASRFGYTAADAHNEAYCNAASYFRKADILSAAVLQPDGTWSVPANATGVYVLPAAPLYRGATTSPAMTMPARRGQILIIPKRLLDRPVKDFVDKPLKVAAVSE
jgi:hypothetical protein